MCAESFSFSFRVPCSVQFGADAGVLYDRATSDERTSACQLHVVAILCRPLHGMWVRCIASVAMQCVVCFPATVTAQRSAAVITE